MVGVAILKNLVTWWTENSPQGPFEKYYAITTLDWD